MPDLIQKCLGHYSIMAKVQPETGQLIHSRSDVLHLIWFRSSKEDLDHTVQCYQPETAGAGSTVPVLHQGWGHTQERSHLFHLRRQLEPVLPFLLCIKDRTTLSPVPSPEATADGSTVPVLHQGWGHTQNVLTCSASEGGWSRFYCSCSTSRTGPHTKTFSPVPPSETTGAGSTVPALHPGQGHTQEDVLTRSASGGRQTQFHPSCSTSRMGPLTRRRFYPFCLRRAPDLVPTFLFYIKDGATHKKTFLPVPPPEATRPGPTLLHQGWSHTQQDVLTHSASRGRRTRSHPSCPKSRTATTLSPAPSPAERRSASAAAAPSGSPAVQRFHGRRCSRPAARSCRPPPAAGSPPVWWWSASATPPAARTPAGLARAAHHATTTKITNAHTQAVWSGHGGGGAGQGRLGRGRRVEWGGKGGGKNSNSKTLFYKDCSLGSVKNPPNS